MFKMRMQALIGALAVSLFAMTTQLNAGSFGIGVAASGMLVEASGQEKLKDTGVISKYGKTGQGVGVPSYYIQYTFGDDGFVVGIERVPGEASLAANLVLEMTGKVVQLLNLIITKKLKRYYQDTQRITSKHLLSARCLRD
jgi:hypothetical protein